MIILSTHQEIKKNSIHIITALSEGDSWQGPAFEYLELY